MEIVACLRRQSEVRQFGNFCGHDVNHTLFILNLAGDNEGRFQIDDEAGFFEQSGPDDGVRGAGLIFQRDETKSFRRAGPLTAGHGSGDRHALTMPDISEVGGGEDARQFVAQ